MASLRARHSRSCALGGIESAVPESGKLDGCTCHPSYSIRHHAGANKYVTKKLDPPANKQLKKARAQLARFEDDVEKGAIVGERIKFATWAEEWLHALEQDKKSPATIGAYSTTIEMFKQHVGEKYLHEIRPSHIEAFRRSMEKVSPTTRNKHVRYLSACFNKAVKLERLQRSPVRLEKDPETPQRGSYFTAVEVKKIAAAMEDGVCKRFFLAALRTGMRASELLTLRWRNVDTENCIIRVRESLSNRQAWSPKSKASNREVDIDPDTAKLFAEWKKKESGQEDELVFLRPDGKPLTNEDATKRILYPAMERAGVPREDGEGMLRVFHSLRDTYAATALAAGLPMYDLSLQLGHSSMQVTETRYAHLETTARAKGAALLGGQFAA